MKRISPTPWSSRLLRPLPVGLGSPFTTSLYKRHFADEDLSIPELSPRNKRNRRKLFLQFEESVGQLWLAEWKSSCSLFIFIRSTVPMISGDFLTRWNAITVRKGREKGQFLGISYFWIEVCFSFTLRRNHLHSQPFKLRQDCMQMLVPYGNTIFSITFCFVLCTKSLL